MNEINKTDLLHMLAAEEGELALIKVEVPIYDKEIDVQLSIAEKEKSSCSEEDKQVWERVINDIREVIKEAKYFVGYIKPVKLKEWNRYIKQESPDDIIILNHLFDKEEKPYFTEKEILCGALKDNVFRERLVHEICDVSGLHGRDDKKKVLRILTEANLNLRNNKLLSEQKKLIKKHREDLASIQ